MRGFFPPALLADTELVTADTPRTVFKGQYAIKPGTAFILKRPAHRMHVIVHTSVSTCEVVRQCSVCLGIMSLGV